MRAPRLCLRFMTLLASSSKTRLLDLRRLAASLPLPPAPADAPPAFVMGGADDFVVDEASAASVPSRLALRLAESAGGARAVCRGAAPGLREIPGYFSLVLIVLPCHFLRSLLCRRGFGSRQRRTERLQLSSRRSRTMS